MEIDEILHNDKECEFTGFKCKSGTKLNGAYVLTHIKTGMVYVVHV